MSYQSMSRSDGTGVVAAVTAVIFLLTSMWVIRAKPSESRRVSASSGASRGVGAVRDRMVEDVRWNRGDQQSAAVASPPAEYQLPLIRGSHGVWHRTGGGVESWGFVTKRNAQEVGAEVLNHYEGLDGWRLAQSEPLGLFAASWGCTVYRTQTKEVVMVTALPERLGERPGGKANMTRVSILRLAGEGALRDVFRQGHFGGGKQ